MMHTVSANFFAKFRSSHIMIFFDSESFFLLVEGNPSKVGESKGE